MRLAASFPYISPAASALAQRWRKSDNSPRIRFASFQFNEGDAPLSWKMNKSQMDKIDSEWDMIVKGKGPDLEQMRCMLAPCAAPPAQKP